jgi:hypothetical protein
MAKSRQESEILRFLTPFGEFRFQLLDKSRESPIKVLEECPQLDDVEPIFPPLNLADE